MPTIRFVPLSDYHKTGETRYIVVDTDTGEILDDARGHGYLSRMEAEAAWELKKTGGRQ